MLTDIAQLLDLGLTAILLVAIAVLWQKLNAAQKQLVDVLREVAGLKAQLAPRKNDDIPF